MEKNRGITLIALVLSIIVLLILAGVSIAMLSGDNGLLKRAGQARDDTVVGQEKEQVELAYISAAVKKLGDNVDKDDLQDELDVSVGENKTKVTGNATLKVKFEDTKNEYKVTSNGNVTKYEALEPTDVYATVCTNGTLVFSNNEEDINTYIANNSTTKADGYEIENIKDVNYYFGEGDEDSLEVKWNWNEDITKAIILNKIAPKNIATWFSGLTNLQSIENISNLNTSNVTNMAATFNSCGNLSVLDVSGFDTSNVTDMNTMFLGCSLTNIDLTNFNTENVVNMKEMFSCCFNLTNLDIRSFNTKNVTNMDHMFFSCGNIKKVYVSNNFLTEKVTISDYMFDKCTSIVGGNGTIYNGSYTDKTYARIDTISTPGYFSNK